MFAEQIWIVTRCYLIFLYITTTTAANTNTTAAVQKLSVIISFQKHHYCSGKQRTFAFERCVICFRFFMPTAMQK